MIRFILLILSSTFILLCNSCTPESAEQEADFDDFFVNLADNIIVPRYAALESKLLALETSSNNFDGTNESLVLLQNKFMLAYLAWQKVSSFEFGPAAEYNALLRQNCNTFPTNSSIIESNIATQNYVLDLPSNYQAKGFPALDYLLFNTDNESLKMDLLEVNRAAYLRDCISDMISRVSNVLLGWDSYRVVFIEANGNDKNSSLSLFFNQYLFDYENLKRNKLALPSGFASQHGVPLNADTGKVEALYSRQSFALITSNLQALENVFLGLGENNIDGIGLYEKLKEYNAQSTVVDGDLAEAIQTQFLLCKSKIADFEFDLPFEIQFNTNQLQEASNELQKMIPMLKNDLRSYLSVTVTQTDADGD